MDPRWLSLICSTHPSFYHCWPNNPMSLLLSCLRLLYVPMLYAFNAPNRPVCKLMESFQRGTWLLPVTAARMLGPTMRMSAQFQNSCHSNQARIVGEVLLIARYGIGAIMLVLQALCTAGFWSTRLRPDNCLIIGQTVCGIMWDHAAKPAW